MSTSDREAIADCKARYCAAADLAPTNPEQARADLAATMTSGCQGDYGFGTLDGADAIGDFMCGALAGDAQSMLHMLHTPLIEVDENSARASWTVTVALKRKGAGATDTVAGRYSDSFRKIDGQWKLARVGFVQMS